MHHGRATHHATPQEGPCYSCPRVGASLQRPALSILNATTSCMIATSRLSRRIARKRRRHGSSNKAPHVTLRRMRQCPDATSRLIEFGVTSAQEEVGEQRADGGVPPLRVARPCSPTSSPTPLLTRSLCSSCLLHSILASINGACITAQGLTHVHVSVSVGLTLESSNHPSMEIALVRIARRLSRGKFGEVTRANAPSSSI